MAKLQLEKLSKEFASPKVTAVNDLSLAVCEGELLVLLGPSGCGKTTLLRMIAGLEQPDAGTIHIAGKKLDGVPPQARPVGMAFQYPALLPQLTVEENIALGPKLRGVARSERQARVRELAELLELEHLLSRLPETLSGGQQQRVSLGRALANQPEVLLLDEPLANLDPVSRAELRDAIRSVQQRLRVTTLYVTHDQLEAAAVGDRIAIMNRGRLEQVGSASELYSEPANLFVAEFFGPDRPNLLEGELRDGFFQPNGATWQAPVKVSVNTKVTCVIRPRAIHLGGDFKAVVKTIQHTGWNTIVTLDLDGTRLRAEFGTTADLSVDEIISVGVDSQNLLLFDAGTGARIRR